MWWVVCYVAHLDKQWIKYIVSYSSWQLLIACQVVRHAGRMFCPWQRWFESHVKLRDFYFILFFILTVFYGCMSLRFHTSKIPQTTGWIWYFIEITSSRMNGVSSSNNICSWESGGNAHLSQLTENPDKPSPGCAVFTANQTLRKKADPQAHNASLPRWVVSL